MRIAYASTVKAKLETMIRALQLVVRESAGTE